MERSCKSRARLRPGRPQALCRIPARGFLGKTRADFSPMFLRSEREVLFSASSKDAASRQLPALGCQGQASLPGCPAAALPGGSEARGGQGPHCDLGCGQWLPAGCSPQGWQWHSPLWGSSCPCPEAVPVTIPGSANRREAGSRGWGC